MKDNVNLKKKKTLALVIVILVISIFFLIFLFKMAKNNKFGNNNISQEESLKKILNMTSYEAKIEVQVKSNKNTKNATTLEPGTGNKANVVVNATVVQLIFTFISCVMFPMLRPKLKPIPSRPKLTPK